MHRIKPVFLLTASLIISLSVFGGTDKSSDKATTESHAVEITESVQVLQLTGTVIDEKNNETLAGASIVVDGNFAIADVLPGKYELTVELISYEPVSMEVDLSKDQTLNIGLLQK